MPVPISVDPVNDMPLTFGFSTKEFPTDEPGPVIKFKTPGGRPASSNISTNLTALSGVAEAGVKTTVVPQIKA